MDAKGEFILKAAMALDEKAERDFKSLAEEIELSARLLQVHKQKHFELMSKTNALIKRCHQLYTGKSKTQKTDPEVAKIMRKSNALPND